VADEDEDITIDLRLRDYLTGGAAKAAKEMEELADHTRKAARALLLLDKRADKAANSLYKLAAAAAAARGATVNLDGSFTGLNASMDKNVQNQKSLQKSFGQTNRAQKATTKGNNILRRSFMMLTRAIKPAAAGLFTLSKMLALVGGAAAAGVAGQQLLAVAGALSSLLSFAALLPVALGGVIAIVAGASVVFGGLGDAIKAAATGDMKALEKATEKMGKNAKNFVRELGPALKLYKGMKNEVQGVFFASLGPELIGAIKNLQPAIRGGLKVIASEFGDLFNVIGGFFSSAKGRTLISRFFRAGGQILDAFGSSFNSLLVGLSDVVEAVQPIWDKLMKSFEGGLSNFGRWMSEIAANGQLEDWLNTAMVTAKALWNILSQLGGIIKGVIEAAGGASGGVGALGALGAALGEINKWVNSIAGQTALQSFFSSLGEIVKTVAPIFATLAGTIGNVLAPTIADIVTNLAPGFTVFLQAFAAAVSALAPYLPPIAAALGSILAALAPLMEPIGLLAQLIAQYLVTALQVLAPIIGTVASAISALLVPFLTAALSVIQALQPYIPQLAAAFTQMGAVLIPVLTQVGQIFADAFLPYLIRLATEIIPQLMPVLTQLIQAFGTFLLVALMTIMPYLPQIAQFLVAVMQNSASLWPVLLTVALGFLKVATAVLIVIGPLFRFIGIVATVATGVQVAIGRIVTGAGRLISAFTSIPGRVASALGGVAEAIAGPFRRGLSIVQGIIGQISNAVSRIQGLAGKVGGVVSNLNPFRFAGGPVDAGKAYTVGEIGKELFVGNNGQTQIIGANGMDPNWTAPSSGMIVPNSMLNAMNHAEQRMAELAEKEMRASISRRELAAIAAASASETHHWSVPVTIMGDVREEVDIERAVNRAITKIERDRKERK